MAIKINGTNTAANPSITGDDTDTGIVYGSDQIDLSTGGSSKVTLNGSNLGVGVTSPTNQLHVYDGTAANDTPEVKIESFRPAIRFKDRSTSSSSAEIVGDNSLKFRVSAPVDDNTALTQRMSLDADGLKFGTDTAAANALSDYEEGFWSPTGLDGVSINVQDSNNVPARRYIKIGKQVRAYFDFTYGSSSSSSTARFGGLPYTEATGGHQASAAAALGYTSKGSDIYCHVSNNNPTFFKVNGTTYNYSEVAGNRMAGVILYTTD
tara:strand:- start:47 stop:841 length:795 start_codon:yes stop_codon:yes gene_type:complete